MIGKNEIVFVTMLVLSTVIVAQVIIYNYFFWFQIFFLLYYVYLKLVFLIFLDANAYVQSEQKVNHLSFECANLKQYGDIYMRNKCPNDW